ncbi:MAG: hypothetical protein V2A73_12015 [Pseudomonadota bacterium]
MSWLNTGRCRRSRLFPEVFARIVGRAVLAAGLSFVCTMVVWPSEAFAGSAPTTDEPESLDSLETADKAVEDASDFDTDDNIDDDPNAIEETRPRTPPATVVAKARRYSRNDYPIEQINRPLTLAAELTEVSLELPLAMGDSKSLSQVLRAAHGVTQDVQVGFIYGGLWSITGSTYEVGKAFAATAAYTIVPGILAAEMRLPFHCSPFAMGLTLGVPFRWRITDKLALSGGQELLEIRMYKFPVDPSDPGYDLVQEAAHSEGDAPAKGNVNLRLVGLYQAKKNLAAMLAIGFQWLNFGDQIPSMLVGASYSPTANLDIGLQAGFQLDEASAFIPMVVAQASYRR